MGTGWRLSPLSAFLLWELLWKTTLPRTFADKSSQVGVGWGEEMLNFLCEGKADFRNVHWSFRQHNKDSNYKIRLIGGDTYSSHRRLLYEKVVLASPTVRRDRHWFLFVYKALDDNMHQTSLPYQSGPVVIIWPVQGIGSKSCVQRQNLGKLFFVFSQHEFK